MMPRYYGLGTRALFGLRARSALVRPVLASPWQARSATPRAWKSGKTEQQKSGHIEAAPNESILWFDNLFPLKLAGLFRAPWQSPEDDIAQLMRRFEKPNLGILDPIHMVKRSIPENLPAKVSVILPRLKDGGAFVKFSHPPEVDPAEIESQISKLLEENPVRPFFNPFRQVQVGLVKGVPWLEDLHRFPKARLRVEFVPRNPGEEAVELSQETLYSLFRRFGKIAEITSQPWDSKVLPKYAYVDFAFVRDAIMARNCLHGYVVPEALGGGKSGTKFRMSYQDRVKSHRIWEWITNHPRIVIPILVALLTGLTVMVFDPIRSYFVKAHVSRKFRLSNNGLYRWFQQQTSDLFAFRRQKVDQAGLNAVWTDRKDLIDQIRNWLMETAETYIVIQGPRGSGKQELVLDQALKGRGNVLVVDCKPIVEAQGESATIKKMASAVGYRPIFSWANSLSSMIDLAVQSTTGVKAGFSETLDSQLQKILQTAANALTEIDISHRHSTDSDADLAVDAYLEAHPEKRAVVVIDNFLCKDDNNFIVYDKIAEWAATLVQSNVAHVIFMTNDSSYSKSLSKSLPDRVFRQLVLGDLSPKVAKNFILKHMSADDAHESVSDNDADDPQEKQPRPKPHINPRELDECITTVGGRLHDLEFLVRRLKSGQTPKQAVAEITEQSGSEIVKMFLAPGKTSGSGWSVEQAWYLMKALASSRNGGEEGELRYNEVLLSDTFKSSLTAPDGESALEGLANAELITVKTLRGRPARIGVGKPVYEAAFRMLAGDRVLAAKMDLAVLTERAKIEAKTIEKAEAELKVLSDLSRQPYEIADRATYLLDKIQKSQWNIEGFETEMKKLKKVLSNEY
ncbi:RNA12 protein-domain-containing protein [Xylariomycetidae sp. FL2044]|nr:RNA12 protein-domain-containing protein [Xylariomycetidae sp. FL2044]